MLFVIQLLKMHLDARHWVRNAQHISVQPVQSLFAPLGVYIKALQVLTSAKSPAIDIPNLTQLIYQVLCSMGHL